MEQDDEELVLVIGDTRIVVPMEVTKQVWRMVREGVYANPQEAFEQILTRWIQLYEVHQIVRSPGEDG